MSPKSSVPQAASLVSQVLMSDEPQRGCQLIRRAEFGVRCNKSQKAVKHTLKNNCGNLVGCHVGATRFWLRLAMQRKCRHLGAPRPLQVA